MTRCFTGTAALFFILLGPLSASDWAHWRGPLQNGVSPDKNLPDKFSMDPKDPNNNLIWKAPYGGRSTPVILGAGVLQARHLVRAALHPALAASADLGAPEHLSWAVLLAGTASASVTGFLCIRFFLRYLERHSFVPFVLYRIALAALVLLFFSGA